MFPAFSAWLSRERGQGHLQAETRACVYVHACAWACVAVCDFEHGGTEGTKETFPLTFWPPSLRSQPEALRVFRGGEGQNRAHLSLSLLCPIQLTPPLPYFFSPYWASSFAPQKQRRSCAKNKQKQNKKKTQVENLCFVFLSLFVLFVCFLQNNHIVTYRTRESVEY